jgi:Domain of unknown function (DUF4249)
MMIQIPVFVNFNAARIYLGRWLLTALTACFLLSCEKEIQINLNEPPASLVVDASIENGRPPVVVLSRSLSYFSQINPELLSASFVRGAVVTVSNGSRTVKLREDSIRRNGGLPVYFYTIDPSSPSNLMFGSLNTSYSLNISSEGKSYSAQTSIPAITRRIDSLWWEELKGPREPEDSNSVLIMMRGADKPGLGSYIRYFTKVNNDGFLPGFNSVFDDQVIDGSTYTVTIDRGFDRNGDFADAERYFKKGDTMTLKLCEIDKASYDFFRTMEFSFQSVGNPFSSPVKVLGNISNGALGAFTGYAAQYRQLIIPRK